MSEQPDPHDDPHEPAPLGFRAALLSVLAAAFGVQSERNRRRDFARGRPAQFIALGVLFTALFVLLVYGAVRLVLHLSGVG